MHGLDEYDSDARWYYPAIMRTTTMDPLAEKYYDISPYAWCANNPVRFVDPDGKTYYSINPQGFVTVMMDENGNTRGIDDKFDKLFVVDSKGNEIKEIEALTVYDQTILSGLATKRQDYKGSYGVSKNGDEVLSVFTFAAKGSDVEWAISGFKGDSYVVNTSHSKGSVEDIMNSNSFNNKEKTFHIHSHPGIDGTRGPSPNDEYKAERFGLPMNRFIYHPATDSWYKYSSPIVPKGYERFNGRHQSIKVKKPTINNLKNPYFR